MQKIYPKFTAEDAFTNYTVVFSFEKNFRFTEAKSWFIENWFTFSISSIVIYILTIFTLQHLMRDRKRFELKKPLIIWNSTLAIFSILGTIRMLPQFIYIYYNYGYLQSVCAPVDLSLDIVTRFWALLFVSSKIIELGDTVFVVLRKQKLLFLHWYHHITVLYITWLMVGERINGGNIRYFITMNLVVHSIMYSYYAARAAKYSPPKFIAMTITTLQIFQMIIGCIITATGIYYGEENCYITKANTRASFTVYASYFLLFGKFFYDSYLSKSSPKNKKTQ